MEEEVNIKDGEPFYCLYVFYIIEFLAGLTFLSTKYPSTVLASLNLIELFVFGVYTLFKIYIIYLAQKKYNRKIIWALFIMDSLNLSSISTFVLYALPSYILSINLYIYMNDYFLKNKYIKIYSENLFKCVNFMIMVLYSFLLAKCAFCYWIIIKNAFWQLFNPFSWLWVLYEMLKKSETYILLYAFISAGCMGASLRCIIRECEYQKRILKIT